MVVEAEYMPARTVEPEATSRLGLELATNGRIIEALIALRYPAAVGYAHDLRAALSSARLSYCVFTEDAKDVSRFPESGWLEQADECWFCTAPSAPAAHAGEFGGGGGPGGWTTWLTSQSLTVSAAYLCTAFHGCERCYGAIIAEGKEV